MPISLEFECDLCGKKIGGEEGKRKAGYLEDDGYHFEFENAYGEEDSDSWMVVRTSCAGRNWGGIIEKNASTVVACCREHSNIMLNSSPAISGASKGCEICNRRYNEVVDRERFEREEKRKDGHGNWIYPMKPEIDWYVVTNPDNGKEFFVCSQKCKDVLRERFKAGCVETYKGE